MHIIMESVTQQCCIYPPVSCCITCENLTTPTNGMIQYSSNSSGLIAKYKCNNQTTLMGNSERVCQCNGTWSGSDPICMCGRYLTGRNGSFTTPEWPDEYPQANFTCEWEVMDLESVIIFEFDREVYGIDNHSDNCLDSYIEFFDTPDRSIGKFCSLKVPEPVVIYTGCAKIVFKGTASELVSGTSRRKGFRIMYRLVTIIG